MNANESNESSDFSQPIPNERRNAWFLEQQRHASSVGFAVVPLELPDRELWAEVQRVRRAQVSWPLNAE